MPGKTLTVGLVQHRCTADAEANLARSISGIEEAARAGAELVLLQELHRTPYFCQREQASAFDLAEPIPGPTTDQLADAAKRHDCVVVASVFERRSAGLYHNTAVVLERDGSIAGRYRKMHIPDDPGYYEKYYFTPGDLGFTPIDTSVGRLGVLVCWDQWFPEAARLMALAGAELLLYPTAIGWAQEDDTQEQARQRDAWITIQRAHAVANGLPVLVCNRHGFEPDPEAPDQGALFWGSSFIAGPQGEILAEGAVDADQTVVVTLDRSRSEAVRRAWPYLRDRRIDHYGDLCRLYRD
ncbi:N-carbamoylputrescine amidase [Natronocella acetinitrilica]|uniref:N-carbamoylputrescine amidase n=1 Tax=Natronocella acetinitrilica TaxID=414046 RepID=A0AAE3G7K3_9GAMM|nr:carbon-nitrogen hydrolase [Natronocella acetinitrilica]MCP1676271.1 N-carbamoylputrescine amidase [Natronocella acetinitrilica]